MKTIVVSVCHQPSTSAMKTEDSKLFNSLETNVTAQTLHAHQNPYLRGNQIHGQGATFRGVNGHLPYGKRVLPREEHKEIIETEKVTESSNENEWASNRPKRGAKGSSDESASKACQENSRIKKLRFVEIPPDAIEEKADVKASRVSPDSASNKRELYASCDSSGGVRAITAQNASRVHSDVASANRLSCVAPKQDILDDPEQKRERRKQANRESARRSRLRKQQEFKKLREKVLTLSGEIDSLESKRMQLSDGCEILQVENDEIMEELRYEHGFDTKYFVEAMNSSCDKPVYGVGGEPVDKSKQKR